MDKNSLIYTVYICLTLYFNSTFWSIKKFRYIVDFLRMFKFGHLGRLVIWDVGHLGDWDSTIWNVYIPLLQAGQRATTRHKCDPARLDLAEVWSKVQAVIQVSRYNWNGRIWKKIIWFGNCIIDLHIYSGMRIRFWPKIGSGSLHLKLREIFKSLLNEYVR